MAVQVDDERAHVIIGAGVQGCNKQRLRPQVRFWTRIAEDLGDGVIDRSHAWCVVFMIDATKEYVQDQNCER